MAGPKVTDINKIIPSMVDVARILTFKIQYEAKQKTPERDAWNKANFGKTPWGIAWSCSRAGNAREIERDKKSGLTSKPGYMPPNPKFELALKTFIIAVYLGWEDLVKQLKRTLKLYGYTIEEMQYFTKEVWLTPENAKKIEAAVVQAITNTDGASIPEHLNTRVDKLLTEAAAEKHDTLNPKLYNKEELLKTKVRDKLLEVVDEFLDDLKDQNIEIKVEDILLIGSNANYNYNKYSDIDLHIITNTKATKYSADVADALYSAYRSLFNKRLDISIYGIELEIYVETENSARVSNGVYSVKKNKWVKKPVHTEIPEYNKEALDRLVDKWELKCKNLIDDIKADKLYDEKRVLKLIEDIYEKLRKKGVAKSEYSIENLAFKELRNKGYLDKLKDYRNELVSKRLSLEERLDAHTRRETYNKIARACGTQPIIQDNGMFFIYNIKASEVSSKVRALRTLDCVAEVTANETGKYDFSNPLEIAMNKIPSKYYSIRGRLKEI
jgi:predicted nucleotidyltransferase